MARQCTQPKRPRNTAWFKEKLMLADAQEAGQILDEEQLAFLADPDDLIRDRNAKLAAFQQEIDTLKETLSNNAKEKESLSQTLTVFKTESKEKESKYIKKEIVLEKQNKEVGNIISEQAFWLKHSSLFETPVTSHTPVRIEAPSKLHKGLGVLNIQKNVF
nr:retrovirus-related Pol polyprotein from transposon TNT 1-94 [Tanacetum cinerariifolium]